MKKSVWIIMMVVIIFLSIALLQETGVIEIKWQMLSIFLAAILAPFKYLFSQLKTDDQSLKEISNEHENLREIEKRYQENFENKIEKRKQDVNKLNNNILRLDKKIDMLELENQSIKSEIEKLSIEKKKEQIRDIFGK